MVFELIGTRGDTGRRVKVRVEASTREHAIERLTKRGVQVDPAPAPKANPVAPAAGSPTAPSTQEATAAAPPATANAQRLKAADASGPAAPPLAAQPPRPGGIQSNAAARGSTASVAAPAGAQSAGAIAASLTGRGWWTRAAALAVAAAVLVIGTMMFAGRSPSSVENPSDQTQAAAPPPAEPAAAAESQEAIRQRISEASLKAMNDILQIDRELHPLFDNYNEGLAAAIHQRYSAVPLTEADQELRFWIGDVVAAARQLLDAERERRLALNQLSAETSGKSVEAALLGAELGSEISAQQGQTAKQQVGATILMGAAGAVLTNLDAQMRKNSINEQYDKTFQHHSLALKNVRSKRQEVKERLIARYDWVVIQPPQ